MRQFASNTKAWLALSLTTFLLLLLVHLGLPALLLLLQVPSFMIGADSFWLLRWENTVERSELEFNVISLLVTAVAIGLIGLLVRQSKRTL